MTEEDRQNFDQCSDLFPKQCRKRGRLRAAIALMTDVSASLYAFGRLESVVTSLGVSSGVNGSIAIPSKSNGDADIFLKCALCLCCGVSLDSEEGVAACLGGVAPRLLLVLKRDRPFGVHPCR